MRTFALPKIAEDIKAVVVEKPEVESTATWSWNGITGLFAASSDASSEEEIAIGGSNTFKHLYHANNANDYEYIIARTSNDEGSSAPKSEAATAFSDPINFKHIKHAMRPMTQTNVIPYRDLSDTEKMRDDYEYARMLGNDYKFSEAEAELYYKAFY